MPIGLSCVCVCVCVYVHFYMLVSHTITDVSIVTVRISIHITQCVQYSKAGRYTQHNMVMRTYTHTHTRTSTDLKVWTSCESSDCGREWTPHTKKIIGLFIVSMVLVPWRIHKQPWNSQKSKKQKQNFKSIAQNIKLFV